MSLFNFIKFNSTTAGTHPTFPLVPFPHRPSKTLETFGWRVCLYLKNNLSFISVNIGCPNVHAVHLTSFNCYILAVYRPPSYTLVDNTNLTKFLHQLCLNKETLILGDFNLPTIDWFRDHAKFLDYDPLTASFVNCFNSIGLSQWIVFPTFTPSGKTLDSCPVYKSGQDGQRMVHMYPLPGCELLRGVGNEM